MNRELRMLIPGRAAKRLLIDQLTESIEKGRIACRNGDARQRRLEPEARKLPGGVREQINPDAHGFYFGSRFKYPAGNSGLVQREPERQSPNAGADDNDIVHVSSRRACLLSHCRDETRLVSALSIKLPETTKFPAAHPRRLPPQDKVAYNLATTLGLWGNYDWIYSAVSLRNWRRRRFDSRHFDARRNRAHHNGARANT